jgi:hypothetical protein
MSMLWTQKFGNDPAAYAALDLLQLRFSEACNFIAPVSARSRCWSRVGLHHLVYRELRERYPDLGSQMACNAIFAVSKVASLAYRRIGRRRACAEGGLPRLEFSSSSPVFFDRHTLSIRSGELSIYTTGGRIRIALGDIDEVRGALMASDLKDIFLTRFQDGFRLAFMCGEREFQDLKIFSVKLPKVSEALAPRDEVFAV